jgi:putative intracellular protease/amidase
MRPARILMVATSHAQMGETGRKTGVWLEELAVPYLLFREAGALVTLASPQGGPVPLDPKSESIIASHGIIRRFQKDAEAILWLDHSLLLSEQRAQDFHMIYLSGGHGPMWDFCGNEHLKRLLEDFNSQNKLIGAVSHGVAALLSLENGLRVALVKGMQLTAFSNSEEQASGLTGTMPFLLQSALVAHGASYSKGPDFVSHTVVDGNIITGQNAASAKEVAKKLLAGLKELPKLAEAVAY